MITGYFRKFIFFLCTMWTLFDQNKPEVEQNFHGYISCTCVTKERAFIFYTL